jgi:hypothetical protein
MPVSFNKSEQQPLLSDRPDDSFSEVNTAKDFYS